MKTYIALLRGINVSGHKLIKMERLRSVLAGLELEQVTTYIQSGNLVFRSNETDTSAIAHQIAASIEVHFGFQVPVVVVTREALEAVVQNNPYPDLQDPVQPYVAFLSEVVSSEAIETLMSIDFQGDTFIAKEKVLYLHYSNSAANTKLTNAAIESKLKVKATSRNWKTIQKLVELAQAIDS